MTHESGHVIVEEGSFKQAVKYKVYGTPIRVWHLIAAALVLGFILGKL